MLPKSRGLVYFGLDKLEDESSIKNYIRLFQKKVPNKVFKTLKFEYYIERTQPYPYLKITYLLPKSLRAVRVFIILAFWFLFLYTIYTSITSRYILELNTTGSPGLYEPFFDKEYIKQGTKLLLPPLIGLFTVFLVLLYYIHRAGELLFSLEFHLKRSLFKNIENSFVKIYKIKIDGYRVSKPANNSSWYKLIDKNFKIIVLQPIAIFLLYLSGIALVLSIHFPDNFSEYYDNYKKGLQYPILIESVILLFVFAFMFWPGFKIKYKGDKLTIFESPKKNIEYKNNLLETYSKQLELDSPKKVIKLFNFFSILSLIFTLVCVLFGVHVMTSSVYERLIISRHPNQKIVIIKIIHFSLFAYAYFLIGLNLIKSSKRIGFFKSLKIPKQDDKLKFFNSLKNSFDSIPANIGISFPKKIHLRFSNKYSLPFIYKNYIFNKNYFVVSQKIFNSLNEKQLSFLITHELAHLQRSDNIYSKIHHYIVTPFGAGLKSLNFNKDKNELLGDFLAGIYLSHIQHPAPLNFFNHLNTKLFVLSMHHHKSKIKGKRKSSFRFIFSIKKLTQFYKTMLSTDYHYEHPEKKLREDAILDGYVNNEKNIFNYK